MRMNGEKSRGLEREGRKNGKIIVEDRWIDKGIERERESEG